MNDGLIKCSDMIMKAVNNTAFSNNEVYSAWKDTVSKIKTAADYEDNEKKMPIGERLAGNTRVVDLKKGILLVETDHPGWIQYLKIYKNFILTGLKRKLHGMEINSLAFKLAGTEAKLFDENDYKKQVNYYQQQSYKKMKEDENKINQVLYSGKNEKNDEKTDYSSNLPPELLEKFESIKNSVLTNDENK